MKYTKTTLMELSHRYASILRKCAYLNMIAVLAIATSASADIVTSTGAVSTAGTRHGGNVSVWVPSYVEDEEEQIPAESTIEDNIEFDASTAQAGTKIMGTNLHNTVNGNVKLIVAGTENERLERDGQIAGLSLPYVYSAPTNTSLITGNLDVIVSNADVTGTIYGNEFQIDDLIYNEGYPAIGTKGKTTITLENSTASADIRGVDASGGEPSDTTKATTLIQKTRIGDLEININNSTVGTEIVAAGAAQSVGDVVINVTGNSSIGKTQNKYDGWILAGANRQYARVANTEVNLEPGEGNTIEVAGIVHVGSRDRASEGKSGDSDEGSVEGTATLNMRGGGIINVGTNLLGGSEGYYALRAYHVAGATALNVRNVNATVGSVAPEFDTITLGEDANLTVNGTFAMAENGILNVEELKNSTILSAGSMVIAEGAKLGTFTIANGTQDGEITFISSSDWDGDFIGDNLSNEFYDIQYKGNGVVAIAKKASGDIIDDLIDKGATAQEAATIAAVTNSTSDHPVLNAITEAVQNGDVKAAAQAARDLAPTTSYQVMGVARDVNNVLSNVTGARMASLGKAGGDVFVGGAVWAQGLYNHSKQSSSSATPGFSANTRGFALGFDGKVNESVVLGAGYGYTKTDVDSQGRDVDVDGHNLFLYGQYQPNAWYVNTMLSYAFSKYTEKKSPMGMMMKAKYDVNTYAVNVMTGYDFNTGITPEGGLRYMLVDQRAYDDGAQHIKTKNNDVLTAVMGLKYATDVKAKDWIIKPAVRVATTYDVMSDGSKANVNIIGGGNYQIAGKRLHRFGVETGVSLTGTIDDLDVILEYNGGFRKDFQSHTGIVKAKYNF